jgi:hypothetical protein
MNLKVVAALAALVGLQCNCAPSSKDDCGRFKTGDFEYRSNGLSYAITRQDSVQAEVNKANGDVTKMSVSWTDSCSYQLNILESTAVYPDSINRLRMASTLTVEILSWNNNYYIYRSKSNVADRVMIDTLWIE